MKVRKKPVVVDAMQYTGDNFREVMTWAESLAGPKGWSISAKQISIDTLEGSMCADVGDWIICGVKREFYPCKPDIFDATYEPA
jgi:hypothetical protein